MTSSASSLSYFRDVTPPDALARKRALDKDFHINRFLFSSQFCRAYDAFMTASFATFLGFAEAARLRSSLVEQQAERTEWAPAWDEMFIAEAESTSQHEIAQRYEMLMHQFAAEVGGSRQAGSSEPG
jgi:hypothetical protein